MIATAEILATGDELLRGDVVDTNAAWLAVRCKELGLSLSRVVAVGDATSSIVTAVREAAQRCTVLLVSGGLGPTDDDRTSAAVAAAAGVDLVRNEDALRAIMERFARFGYTFTPNNAKQADLPRGAELLPNHQGTAPGFALQLGVCRVYCMPGVPHELKAMFDDAVAPRLARDLALQPALIRTLNIFGVGESQIDHLLAHLLPDQGCRASFADDPASAAALQRCEVSIHYRASFPETKVVLVVRPATGCTVDEAGELLARLEAEARRRIGRFVFSTDDATLASAVVAALRQAGATLALAESCTGGQVGDLITSAPGSSEVFHLGVVSYHNAIKERVLGVPAEVLQTVGAVSRECVEAMALGARRLAGATYGVAVSGVAGPGGGSPEKPVGTVHFALATPRGVRHLKRLFPFDRDRVKRISAHVALYLVLDELRSGGDGDPLDGRWTGPSAKERA
jgi:nicotinamide-nucleotide amidase